MQWCEEAVHAIQVYAAYRLCHQSPTQVSTLSGLKEYVKMWDNQKS